VGLGLATLHGGTAEAGSWSYVKPPGTWFYYGSIDGCAIIGSVPSPTQHPARLYCEVTVTKVESLCSNPATHEVSPGEAATQVVFSSANPINDNDLLTGKNKGKAALCVEITSADADCTTDSGNLLCNRDYCVNPNWHILRVVTTEFRADCQTQACTGTLDTSGNCIGGDWVQKDKQSCECTFPAGYSIDNLPTPCPDPLHPTAECAPYQCFDVATGLACQLQ